MDKASIIGITVGIFAILGAYILESGYISIIIQPSAALVVFGGTLGAVLLNFSLPSVSAAFKASKKVFTDEKQNTIEIIEQIVGLAHLSRQKGLLSLQDVIPSIEDKFLKRGTQLVIDTTDPQLLQDILIREINLDEEQELINARIFEAIGGFAPTFGIVGAVLGLIQVMGNLQDPTELGHGIASAFVATLYGVGSANLIFLPIAGKLKMKLRDEMLLKEMIVMGLVSIQMGENPALIEEKLLTFFNYAQRQNNYLEEYQERVS